MWQCNYCERKFDEPVYREITENLDGENGWWHHVDLLCPYCGAGCIEEVGEKMEEEE